MITILVSLLIGFIGGFIAGLKNASSSKVEKAKTILDALKGK
jgi:hypothetical protein